MGNMSIEQQNELQTISSGEEAQNLCVNLYNTTNELISLLDEETGLLRKAQTSEISKMQIRKESLTATLSHYMDMFRRQADEIRELAPESLKDLQKQRDHFQKSIEANHGALSAMQAVSERILQTVSQKVSERESGPEVYTPAGGVTNAGVKRTAAITIDTTL